MRRSTRRIATLFALAALTLPLAACADKGGGGEDAGKAGPARLVDIAGTDRKQVVLTDKAAERIGLETGETTEEARFGAPRESVVPYSAVVYDAHGEASVYTNPDHLTYARQAVKVDRIEGDSVYLAEGPAPGTAVVVVGANELFGTETGIGEFE